MSAGTMSYTSTGPSPTSRLILGPDERCDRCLAAGKLRLELISGGELVFCGHHANRYAPELVKIATAYAVEVDFKWRGALL